MGGTHDAEERGVGLRWKGPLAVAFVLVFRLAPARAPIEPSWPDTFVGRLEALALMQARSAEILSSDSATLVLEQWCRLQPREHEGRIAARVLRGVERPPTAEQRERLGIGAAARRARASIPIGGGGAAVLQ